MKRWAVVILAGVLVVPIASRAFDRIAGPAPSPAYRDPGDMLMPGRMRSSWGRRLDPTGAIPRRGFKAIYFSRDDPTRAVFQENVDSIAIKYAWADFHGIDSPRFGAYWVGRMTFARPTTRQISVSQSWAKSRIYIDGNVVFDGGNKTAFGYRFAKGAHLIEVEFINNWHTVEYKVTVDEPATVIGEDQVRAYLPAKADGALLYYIGLYESASKDTGVTVTVPPAGKPIVLWLTSYEAIDWTIRSRDPVRNVFVSSYAPGSRVRGAGVKLVTRVDRAIGIHSEGRRCSCAAGTFHCEGERDLADVADKLRATTGMDLAGYAMTYSASDMAIRPLDGDALRRVLKQRMAEEAARKVCVGNANPDFDTLMK